MTDTVGSFLSQIKNAYMAKHTQVEARSSNFSTALGQVLKKTGYVKNIEKTEAGKLKIELIYKNKLPALTGMKRFSLPGRRYYLNLKELRKAHQGIGHLIVSTPMGLMTQKEAVKNKTGGEVICKVW